MGMDETKRNVCQRCVHPIVCPEHAKQYIRLIVALFQLGRLHEERVEHGDSLRQHCYLQFVLLL